MVELFRIGFLSINLFDILDILIVSYIVYKLYTILKGTLASQIFIGLMIVLVISFIVQLSNLKALSWLLKLVSDIWVIAFIIVFQPEIRRLLVILARNPFVKLFVKQNSFKSVEVLVDAAFELSQLQHGALIIIIKSTGIRGFSETGEIINARLSKDLLRSIFYPRSPLHDGAVVVKGDVIEAARVTLPLAQNNLFNGEKLGTRHRAGIGISEQADVISLIVSEETGSISIAENGHLTRGLSKDGLRKRLNLAFKDPKYKGFKGFIEQIKNSQN
jgi:diadenylate cyclase